MEPVKAKWCGDPETLLAGCEVDVLAFDLDGLRPRHGVPEVLARLPCWIRYWPPERDYPFYRSCDLADLDGLPPSFTESLISVTETWRRDWVSSAGATDGRVSGRIIDAMIEIYRASLLKGLEPDRWKVTPEVARRLREELALDHPLFPWRHPPTLMGLPFEVVNEPSDVGYVLISRASEAAICDR